jgi:hypothetical protein
MEEKSFIDRYPNLCSVMGVVVWFAAIFLMSLLCGCRSARYVEIVKTDTLHVYHTDTLKVVHNDTIYSVKVETKHVSIIIKEKYYLDADGNVTLTEKEKESYRESDTNSQLIRHTIDSLARVWMDSVYQARYEDKPVIVEVEKPVPWYQKVWDWVVSKFAWIGMLAVIVLLAYFFVPKILKMMKT